MAHAKFSPSGADRWAVCTKSVEMEEGLKDSSSSYAEEGTEAHDLLERSLKAKTQPSKLEPSHHAAKDVDNAYWYVEKRLSDKRYMVFSELQVRLSKDCWGTADIVILDTKAHTLEIIDYKHGRGVSVEADCRQLQIYGEAAVRSLKMFCKKPVKSITTTVVQPRCPHDSGPIRSEEYTSEALADAANQMLDKIKKIKNGDTEYCVNTKACRWCKAAGNCKALAEEALAHTRSLFKQSGVLEVPSVDDIKTLSIQEKIAIYEARDLLKLVIASVEEELMTTVQAGGDVPGYKLVAGRSNRKWGDNEDAVMDFCRNELKLKVAEYAPPKLLGPAAVEKLIDPKRRGGKAKLEKLAGKIVKPEGKPTLVPESDKRPAMGGFFKPVEKKNPLL